MPPLVLRLARRRTNAELIADAARLGHVRGRLLDATYGKGIWWRLLDGGALAGAVGMDRVQLKVINLPRGVRADFRRPPFPPDTFATIFHDADYKLNGTPTSAASRWVKRAGDATVDERYGADVRKPWTDRIADMLDGIAWWTPCPACYGHPQMGARTDYSGRTRRSVIEVCAECEGSGRGEVQGLAPLLEPGGTMLVKCMDQVVGGKVRFQSFEVMKRAEAAGLRIAGRLDREMTPRWQDPDRAQRNEAANYSSLIILKDQRPARRTRRKAG